MHVTDVVPGTEVEVSTIDTTKLSFDELAEVGKWLSNNGASIVKCDRTTIKYVL